MDPSAEGVALASQRAVANSQSSNQPNRPPGTIAAEPSAWAKATSQRSLQEQALWGRDDGTTWTTTRCMRLLRPVRVQLNTLRREKMTPEKIVQLIQQRTEEEATARAADADMNMSVLMDQNLRIGSDARDPDFVPAEPIEATPPARAARRFARKFSLRQNRKTPGLVAAHDRTRSNKSRLSPVVLCDQLIDQACVAFSVETADPTSRDLGGEYAETEQSIAVKSSRTARSRMGHAPFDCYGKLFRAFDDVIKATTGRCVKKDHAVAPLRSSEAEAAPKPLPDTQQLSLFQSCLRSVPKLIAHRLQALEEQDQEDRYDVDEEVYAQLEEMSIGPSGGGWRPLRLVVRSHALHLLCEGIRDGIISPAAAKSQMNSCIVRNFAEGAREIMKAWGDGLARGTISTLMQRTSAWDMRITSKELGLERHVWDWMVDALGDPVTEIDIMSDMSYLWTHCIYSLAATDSRERESAIRLVQKIMSCALGARYLDLDATIQNTRLLQNGLGERSALAKAANVNAAQPDLKNELVPMLSTIMVFLTTIACQESPFSARTMTALRRICEHVEKVTALIESTQLDELQRTAALVPYLSINILSSYTNLDVEMPRAQDCSFQKLVCDDLSDEVYSCLANHTMKTADAIFRHGRDSHSLKHHVQHITRHLVKGSRERQDPTSFLARVAVRTAASLAERDPKRTNVSFALDLENDAGIEHSGDSDEDDNGAERNSGQDNVTPGHGRTHSRRPRFRFEDSISEWVQRTPEEQSARRSFNIPALATRSLGRIRRRASQLSRALMDGANSEADNSGISDGSPATPGASTDVRPVSSGRMSIMVVCPPRRRSSSISSSSRYESDGDTTLVSSRLSRSPTASMASFALSTDVAASKKSAEPISRPGSSRADMMTVEVVVPPVSASTRRMAEAHARERARQSLVTAETHAVAGRKRHRLSLSVYEGQEQPSRGGNKKLKPSRRRSFGDSPSASSDDGDWLPGRTPRRRQERVGRPSLRKSSRASKPTPKRVQLDSLLMEGDSEDELAL